MAGVVRAAWGGRGGVREEEDEERSCCCWASVRSLDLLSSVPTITSTPPPPAFCLLTFHRMQPSSCNPPRPLPFHSPAGYGALPIPPSRLPLPPRLNSGRYISIMTTIPIATSQPPGREELVWLCLRLRERRGVRGKWDPWWFNTCLLWETVVMKGSRMEGVETRDLS